MDELADSLQLMLYLAHYQPVCSCILAVKKTTDTEFYKTDNMATTPTCLFEPSCLLHTNFRRLHIRNILSLNPPCMYITRIGYYPAVLQLSAVLERYNKWVVLLDFVVWGLDLDN
jgi:hypothetical protein